MQLFKLTTALHQFDSFIEFIDAFTITSKDLIITNQFLYEPFMKALDLPAHFIMQESYGLGEPTDQMMNAILRDVRALDYERVIAIGGGTVIDISKLFVLQNLQDVTAAFEKTMPLIKEKQLVILPTTCGTGSEVTNLSIAQITAKNTKMGLACDEITADHAVLVSEFLKGLPYKFYITSSIDALIHAVESYVSPKANIITRMFSEKAIGIILHIYQEIEQKGPEQRQYFYQDMLLASTLAGIAFGNAGVGAVHAMSYPLGGVYHVPHGEANYQFFTEVFKAYQKKQPEGALRDLNAYLAQVLEVSPENVYARLDELLGKLLERNKLSAYGMKEEEIETFADSVMASQQRLLANNCAELSRDEIRDLYAALY